MRLAWSLFPDDFSISLEMAFFLSQKIASSHPDQRGPWKEEQVRFLMSAVAARPSNVSARYFLGNALLNDGRYQEALDCYRRAIGLRPDADSYRHLAKFFSRQKRFGEAADAYGTAIRLEPDNARTHFEFAHSLKEQNQPQAAEAEYREALRLEPDDAYRRYFFGCALLDWKRRDEAIVQFRESVRLDSARGHIGASAASLVNNLNAAGRYDEAIAAARDLIRVKPDADGPYRLLVESLWRKGPPDAVAAEYRKGLPEPNLALAYEILGRFMAQQQRWDDASDALRQVVRLWPDSVAANRGLGDLPRARKGEWRVARIP